MAQLYSTGPALIYVGQSTAGALFLGTAESKPIIDVDQAFIPVMNDLGGQVKRFDSMAEGQDGLVSVTLSRWNERVYQLVTAHQIGGVGAKTAAGTNAYGFVGTLMITEGFAYSLYVVFPYASYAAFNNPVSGAMPKGYRFPAAHVEGKDSTEPGTVPLTRSLTFQCDRVMNTDGSFLLYDFAVGGLPAWNANL